MNNPAASYGVSKRDFRFFFFSLQAAGNMTRRDLNDAGLDFAEITNIKSQMSTFDQNIRCKIINNEILLNGMRLSLEMILCPMIALECAAKDREAMALKKSKIRANNKVKTVVPVV